MKKLFQISLLILAGLVSLHCGDEKKSKDKNGVEDFVPPDLGVSPSESLDPNASLETLAINTFEVDITVAPEFIDFEPTPQGTKVTGVFTLRNGTGEDKIFSVDILGLTGGFRIVEEDESHWASKGDIAIPAGGTKDFTLEFDGMEMGVRQGYLEIRAQATDGFIRFPFRGTVT
ncbi:MAG: hypothetical protein Q7T11_04490, partial [Deltaproteobacteria bacterium]|nr:hypothetical protein [Deltaproteobacteria bacterium]